MSSDEEGKIPKRMSGEEKPSGPALPSGANEFHHHVIPTERCGALNVWVQGDLALARNEGKEQYPVFLTVHDVGMNHNSFEAFINHPSMFSIKMRAIFVHVDLMGQEDHAEDLPDNAKFPSLQEIGEDLVNILDILQIKCVIGMGEGAGANIMFRFGMMHVTRCLGIICINPTGTAAGMKEKLSHFKLARMIVNTDSNGPKLTRSLSQEEDDGEPVSSARFINTKNVQRYADAFQNRTDISNQLERALACDTLLVAGAKSSHVQTMDNVFNHCDKTKTSILRIDDVNDVISEAPAKLANSILLFVKGLGWLTSVNLPNVERRSSRDLGGRRMSMDDYDKPNIRRLSLTGAE
jgi:hypothetical protein